MGSEPDAQASDLDATLTFVPAVEVMSTPRPVEIVAGVLYADRVSVLVSESGTGKTFLGLDLSAHVSADLTWHGRPVQPGSVAYVSFEGDALGVRLRALREVAGQRLEHVYILHGRDPLSPIIDRDRVELASRGETAVVAAVEALRNDLTVTDRPSIRLLVVDTVRASLSGSEDSSESVSAYLRSVRRLMTRVPGAATLLLHHSGWQDGDAKRKRERGSSAFRGNVDATLYLEAETYDAERGEARLILRALKVRDGERPAPLSLIRRRVDSGWSQTFVGGVRDITRAAGTVAGMSTGKATRLNALTGSEKIPPAGRFIGRATTEDTHQLFSREME